MMYDYAIPRHTAHARWLLAVEVGRCCRQAVRLQKGQLLDTVGEHGDIRQLASQNDQPVRVCRPIARHAEEQPEIDNRQQNRSEEHTSELQSLMRISYAVFCLKKKKKNNTTRAKERSKK